MGKKYYCYTIFITCYSFLFPSIHVLFLKKELKIIENVINIKVFAGKFSLGLTRSLLLGISTAYML